MANFAPIYIVLIIIAYVFDFFVLMLILRGILRPRYRGSGSGVLDIEGQEHQHHGDHGAGGGFPEVVVMVTGRMEIMAPESSPSLISDGW
ncbi:hypothetical protein AMTR_s00012p00264110 [Amborella trichopoda]|uniref:Uncharacterized protein n=1 Tax=Amborella trichopoda TaxID=13333 RepID=W1PJ87_AMBTC|nr:hypothetical protein AMTR_s00012p00264110 [Amborella trichopoda]